MELTFEDFKAGKFYFGSDGKTYRSEYIGKNDRGTPLGETIQIDAIINNDTLSEINEYIKSKFFENVEYRFNQLKRKFDQYFDTCILSKDVIIQNEINALNGIFKGNYIQSPFIGNYLIVESPGNVFWLDKREIPEISKYYNHIFNKHSNFFHTGDNNDIPDTYFIENKVKFESQAWIMAEVLIRFLNYLNNPGSHKKTDITPIPGKNKLEYTTEDLGALQGFSAREVAEILFFLNKYKLIGYPSNNWQPIGNILHISIDNVIRAFNKDAKIIDNDYTNYEPQKRKYFTERLERYLNLFNNYPSIKQDITEKIQEINKLL